MNRWHLQLIGSLIGITSVFLRTFSPLLPWFGFCIAFIIMLFVFSGKNLSTKKSDVEKTSKRNTPLLKKNNKTIKNMLQDLHEKRMSLMNTIMKAEFTTERLFPKKKQETDPIKTWNELSQERLTVKKIQCPYCFSLNVILITLSETPDIESITCNYCNSRIEVEKD